MQHDFELPNGALVFATLEQGTPEWLQARSGVATASELAPLLVKGKGPYGLGAGALTYAHTVAAEILIGGPVSTFTGNAHTERGHEKEAEWADTYAFLNDETMHEIGFVRLPLLGYSPDRFVGEDGLLEVKSPVAYKQVGFLRDPGFPSDYRAQCLAGLLATGRDWIDLVTGCDGLPMCVRRLRAEDVQDELKALEEALTRFNAYVQETVAFVRAVAGSDQDAADIAAALPVAAE